MPSPKKLAVLIAEDDFFAREKIKELVETIGYTLVGEAANGLEAIELAEKLLPNVILMDIQMPKMDGLEATRQIQARHPVPVVVLSAYQTPELIEQASEVGVGAFLVKPPTAREIDRTITIAVARFADMLELRRLNAQLQNEMVERNRIEQKLKASLEEKVLLLQEIHHRVKNNLTVISSLLNLQADGVGDEQAKNAFKDSRNRVQAMARIHEQLYQADNLGKIDMETYIKTLSSSLRHTFGAYGVTIWVDAPAVSLGIDAAIPCGLIVNELITNAFKYAFPRNTVGNLWLSLKPAGNQTLRLEVRDDGPGLPPNFNPDQTPSLGLQLVKLLAHQLNGTLEITPPPDGRGANFAVTIQP